MWSILLDLFYIIEDRAKIRKAFERHPNKKNWNTFFILLDVLLYWKWKYLLPFFLKILVVKRTTWWAEYALWFSILSAGLTWDLAYKSNTVLLIVLSEFDFIYHGQGCYSLMEFWFSFWRFLTVFMNYCNTIYTVSYHCSCSILFYVLGSRYDENRRLCCEKIFDEHQTNLSTFLKHLQGYLSLEIIILTDVVFETKQKQQR